MMTAWRDALSGAKQEAKSKGDIKGDADLAARVSELLEEMGLPKVDRGAVNHWLKGRNPPSMAQFIALCTALSISPSAALSGEDGGGERRQGGRADLSPIEDEVVSIMRETTDRGRAEIALFARQTVERYPRTDTNGKAFGSSQDTKAA